MGVSIKGKWIIKYDQMRMKGGGYCRNSRWYRKKKRDLLFGRATGSAIVLAAMRQRERWDNEMMDSVHLTFDLKFG